VTLRVPFGFIRVENAGFDQSSNVGMVASKARDGIVSHQIKPAVAYMNEVRLKIVERQSGTGCAHAVKFRMRVCELANSFMCLAKAIEKGIPRVTGRITIVDISDGFYGQSTGFLAALVSPHPVSHQSESTFLVKLIVALWLPVTERVLVILALAADIAQAGDLNSWSNWHSTSLERILTGSSPARG
jgi:hypothetical protein